MVAAQSKNELMSPEQLAERMGISLRMVREIYYRITKICTAWAACLWRRNCT